jgi:hypothetical protein
MKQGLVVLSGVVLLSSFAFAGSPFAKFEGKYTSTKCECTKSAGIKYTYDTCDIKGVNIKNQRTSGEAAWAIEEVTAAGKTLRPTDEFSVKLIAQTSPITFSNNGGDETHAFAAVAAEEGYTTYDFYNGPNGIEYATDFTGVNEKGVVLKSQCWTTLSN